MSEPDAIVSGVPESEPETLSRVADELTSMRQSLERFIAENAELRTRLEISETARADLQAQTEHLLQVLADSRYQLRECRAQRKREG